MISGIGIPSSQSRIGMIVSFQLSAAFPGAVAKAAAFSGCKTCAERAKKKRGCDPERKADGGFPRSVRVGLDLRDDIVHAFFCIRLTETGARSNDLGSVFPVGSL